MATVTLNAGSISDVAGVGTESWTDTAEAAGAPDGDFASVLLLGGSTSHYLVGVFAQPGTHVCGPDAVPLRRDERLSTARTRGHVL